MKSTPTSSKCITCWIHFQPSFLFFFYLGRGVNGTRILWLTNSILLLLLTFHRVQFNSFWLPEDLLPHPQINLIMWYLRYRSSSRIWCSLSTYVGNKKHLRNIYVDTRHGMGCIQIRAASAVHKGRARFGLGFKWLSYEIRSTQVVKIQRLAILVWWMANCGWAI